MSAEEEQAYGQRQSYSAPQELLDEHAEMADEEVMDEFTDRAQSKQVAARQSDYHQRRFKRTEGMGAGEDESYEDRMRRVNLEREEAEVKRLKEQKEKEAKERGEKVEVEDRTPPRGLIAEDVTPPRRGARDDTPPSDGKKRRWDVEDGTIRRNGRTRRWRRRQRNGARDGIRRRQRRRSTRSLELTHPSLRLKVKRKKGQRRQ